ncbi:MAG: arsenic efflux protein [Candidatus Bathyarchaeota archaeon]|nr:MAG: arsenic efflux protein [Candidatus Bathyarchaeota archaeon]
MWDNIVTTILETLKIVTMVTVIMTLIEFLELKFEKEIREKITRKPINQYAIASVLGAIPGCTDAFFIVSLYLHGLVGFGALVAVMLSTAGDEAFVMLSMIPEEALLIFIICAIFGLIGGLTADRVVKRLKIETSQPCAIEFHKEEFSTKHFFREHVYDHILKKHIPKLFLWIFLTMFFVNFLVNNYNLEPFISNLPELFLIIIAALLGLIPESGPHLLLLILYSKGLVPFSVLLVNTLSQDGHGLLPLLSYSLKDTIYVQIFTTLFSIAVGVMLYFIGF